VVACRVFVMLCCLVMMFRCLLGHYFPQIHLSMDKDSFLYRKCPLDADVLILPNMAKRTT
jgi:hypothetical protein